MYGRTYGRTTCILKTTRPSRSSIKKHVKYLRRNHLNNEASKISEAKQNRESTKLWRNAKEHGQVITRKPNPIKCEGLKEFFKKHFNPDHSNLTTPSEISDPPLYITDIRNPEIYNAISNDPPSIKEISEAINKLSINIASIDIETEILQNAFNHSDPLKELLLNYFNDIWKNEHTPRQWDLTKICLIWKRKGSPKDPLNYPIIKESLWGHSSPK